ncbi:tRNA(His) guanylyltransferase [Paragonimus westermani]|uniref:Probable tRNA(His) guanylyltransferase n=1 Tax=Paragonimus westermani TaxID=34504 RepID=A0A5J4NFH4_9TREM|nr:tRNA(His) guanylyltransferase [Paragonimus westermani]
MTLFLVCAVRLYSTSLLPDFIPNPVSYSKLSSTVVSLFAASYVFEWPNFLPNVTLLYPPAFDSRVILYPTNRTLRDYLSWRQADCHINNLYNTCFWRLVQESSLTTTEAEERLRGTLSGDKNELLFSEFGCNYNNEPELFRKGTVLYRNKDSRGEIEQANIDIIKDTFWNAHPEILEPD